MIKFKRIPLYGRFVGLGIGRDPVHGFYAQVELWTHVFMVSQR